MGISGLLPLLKDIHANKHISDYAGQTLGVDAYVWLHRGSYGCAEALVQGVATTKYVDYAMHYVRMLKYYGVKPYVVFDGGPLPSKAGTEEERRLKREASTARANALLKEGKQREARELATKSVDITPEMAYQLIKALKHEGVPYVVAPYEADAQLTFLQQVGLIDGVITEDSDLLVFGCSKVILKLDKNGDCVEIQQSQIGSNRAVSFAGWSITEFRQMAILSGCDYLPSIVGMGLKNAHALLRRYKSVDKVLQAVRFEGKLSVPPTYANDFRRAELTFLHQRVFDPRGEDGGRATTLTPLPDGVDGESPAFQFIGPPMSNDLARGIATGDVDPISRLPMIDIAPDFQPNAETQNRGRSTSPTKPSAAKHGKAAAKSGSIALLKNQPSIKDFFGKKKAPAVKRVYASHNDNSKLQQGSINAGSCSQVGLPEEPPALRSPSRKKPRLISPRDTTTTSRFFLTAAKPERDKKSEETSTPAHTGIQLSSFAFASSDIALRRQPTKSPSATPSPNDNRSLVLDRRDDSGFHEAAWAKEAGIPDSSGEAIGSQLLKPGNTGEGELSETEGKAPASDAGLTDDVPSSPSGPLEQKRTGQEDNVLPWQLHTRIQSTQSLEEDVITGPAAAVLDGALSTSAPQEDVLSSPSPSPIPSLKAGMQHSGPSVQTPMVRRNANFPVESAERTHSSAQPALVASRGSIGRYAFTSLPFGAATDWSAERRSNLDNEAAAAPSSDPIEAEDDNSPVRPRLLGYNPPQHGLAKGAPMTPQTPSTSAQRDGANVAAVSRSLHERFGFRRSSSVSGAGQRGAISTPVTAKTDNAFDAGEGSTSGGFKFDSARPALSHTHSTLCPLPKGGVGKSKLDSSSGLDVPTAAIATNDKAAPMGASTSGRPETSASNSLAAFRFRPK